MSTSQLIILISSRRIAAGRLGRDGALAASASRELGAALTRDTWASGLKELDAPLAGILAELGARRGSRALMYYRGVENVSELVRVPTGDPAAAREATTLALADVAAFPIEEHASNIGLLQRREGHTLALGAADRAEHLDALAALVGRAGVRARSFCPLAAAMIAGLACQTDVTGDTGAALHAHIGEDQTTLLTRRQGVIELAREVEFGLVHLIDTLATHLRRGEHETSAAGGPSEYAGRARSLLHERGLAATSRREAALDRQSMVAIQPALQRLIVEVRQTLRFGFGESTCQGAPIVLHGPATRVPGLKEYLSEVFSDEIRVMPDVQGDLDLACVCAGTGAPTLLPPALLSRRAVRRVRGLAAAGAVLALGLVALEHHVVTRALAREQSHAAETSSRLADARKRSELLGQSRAEESRIALSLASLRSALGPVARVAPALAAVAGAAPEELRLTDVRLADSAEESVLTLDGVIVGESERGAADVLRAYVRALESEPAFASVRLGATRSIRVDGEAAQRFTIDASLTSLPALAVEESQ